jgi:nucleotide-binding universal stress UspA family protein
VLVVNDTNARGAGDSLEREAAELIAKHGLSAQLEVVEDEDILRAIVRRSRGADLIVIGGRRGGPLTLLLGRSLGQEIVEEVSCPVISIVEYQEREAFWPALMRPLSRKEEPIAAVTQEDAQP